jgi:hypothetical protein
MLTRRHGPFVSRIAGTAFTLFIGSVLNAAICHGQGRQHSVAEIQNITRQCVAWVRQSFPKFDAYYDAGDGYWHTLENQESAFYFRKCLTEQGLSPE